MARRLDRRRFLGVTAASAGAPFLLARGTFTAAAPRAARAQAPPPCPTGAPCDVGQWGTLFTKNSSPTVDTEELEHGHLLAAGPDAGRVVFIDNSAAPIGPKRWIFDPTQPNASAWNQLGAFPLNAQASCNGHVALQNGNVMFFGGGPGCGSALRQVWLFDVTLGTWSTLPPADMLCPRWYPTAVRLANNRVAVVNGCGGTSAPTCTSGPVPNHEVYDANLGSWLPSGLPVAWTSFACADVIACQYLRAHLLPAAPGAPNGYVFWIGGTGFASSPPYPPNTIQPSQFLDPGSNTVLDGTSPTGGRSQNSVLLIDLAAGGLRRVVVVGGHAASVSPVLTWHYIDNPSPGTGSRWNPQGNGPDFPPGHGRVWHDTVIMPDGRILVVGGRHSADTGLVPPDPDATSLSNTQELRKPLRRNPFDLTSPWQILAQAQTPRDYHSGALLDLTGRVLSFGGEWSSVHTTDPSRADVEIFTPPEFFSTSGALIPQPQILPATPSVIPYANDFMIYLAVPPGGPSVFSSVSLVRPGSTTHAFNMEQRYLRLAFSEVATAYDDQTGWTAVSLRATSPADATWAPEGYYILFAVTPSGFPSAGKFVRIPS